jgi:glycosyltransferase involved in cell wall biosynthesis
MPRANPTPDRLEAAAHPLPRVAVVIPCYRVRHKILDVIARVPDFVSLIVCVDDCCPEDSGAFIRENVTSDRLLVVRNAKNLGVGGACIRGFREALARGAEIVAKIDGDGQMDPQLLPRFITPIVNGQADYVKGNRFVSVEAVRSMPGVRLFGNSVLSLLCKLSSGYWHIFDPNNGYVCCHADVLRRLPLNKIAERYFFESDMLFRLGIARALVVDVPMAAVYADEKSSLHVGKVVLPFLRNHLRNFVKRVFYRYFLLDFNVASVELVFGLLLILFGSAVGIAGWIESAQTGLPATAGTVMLAALPFITGVQLLISAINFDVTDEVRVPLQRLIREREPAAEWTVNLHDHPQAAPAERAQAMAELPGVAKEP